MVTGTFTYNALRMKTLKEHKNRKKNCESFKLNKSNAVRIGMIAIKSSFSRPSGLSLVHKALWSMYSCLFFLTVDWHSCIASDSYQIW